MKMVRKLMLFESFLFCFGNSLANWRHSKTWLQSFQFFITLNLEYSEHSFKQFPREYSLQFGKKNIDFVRKNWVPIQNKRTSVLAVSKQNLAAILKKMGRRGKRNVQDVYNLNNTYLGYHITDHKVIKVNL